MNKAVSVIFFVLITLQTEMILAQEKKDPSDKWLKIDGKLINHIITVTDKNMKVVKGLLTGIKGDSLYLNNRNQIVGLSLKSILSLSIESKSSNYFATVAGAFSGMYLGTVLFLTSGNHPAKYLEYDGPGVLALYELLFATVGGGVGYLIDQGIKKDLETFYFEGDNDEVEKEINKFKNFVAGESDYKKIKLSINFAQVETRKSELPENPNNYYNYFYDFRDTHSFNMIRNLSISYNAFDNFDFGIAVNWFGEPTFSYYGYTYEQNQSTSSTINQEYEGKGLYLVSKYLPFKNILPDIFEFSIGTGVGFGEVDFRLSRNKTISNYYQEPFSEETINETKNINKTLFSYLLTGELLVKLYPSLSLSLYGDYIHLPETMPAIPEFNLKERNLGNLSYGLGIVFSF